MSRTARTPKIVFSILAIVGTVAIVAGFVMLARSWTMAATGQRAEGVVIQNVWSRGRGSTARPIVRFEAEGRVVEIKGGIGTRPPAYSVGDKVIVFYSAGNPEHAVIDSFVEQYLLAIVFGGVGMILLGVGGGFLFVPAWIIRNRQRIISEGIPVQAKVADIRLVSSLRVNGRSPWVIVAEFTDQINGRMVTATSHYLWQDPSWRYPVGSNVTIYHLPERPGKHAFQLDDLQTTG